MSENVSIISAILLSRASLAAHSYADYAAETDISDWEKIAESPDILGETNTGFYGALYARLNEETLNKEYAIVFRGYDDIKDLADVLKAGFGGIPEQLKSANAFVTKISVDYKINLSEVDFVGHSLGGYLAKAIGIFWGAQQVFAFNSPGFKNGDIEKIEDILLNGDQLLNPLRKPYMEEPKTTVHNINSKFDWIGLWGYQSGVTLEIPTDGKHHNIVSLCNTLRDMTSRHAFNTAAEKKPEHPGTTLQHLSDAVRKSEIIRTGLKKAWKKPDHPKS